MLTQMNNIINRNIGTINFNEDNEFFSSADSDEDVTIYKKKVNKKKRSSILSLDTQSIDIFQDKREDNIKILNDLRRIHNSKETKLMNEKIGWGLIYILLFSDYFNNLRDRKINKKNNNSIYFNLKEIELRIKKMMNKIKNKRTLETNLNKNEETMEFPSSKWIDRPFSEMINDIKYNEKEKDDFIPSFIKSFKNFSDNESKRHERNKSKPNVSTFSQLNNPGIHFSSNLSLKSQNLLSIPNNSIERKRKSMAYIQPIFNPFSQFNKKKEQKFISNTNTIKNNSNSKIQNKGAVLYVNYKIKENVIQNNLNHPNIDLLRTNKKFYDMLINKYPKYEEDIINIKNNFMAYDIELNKNEPIFKKPENLVIKHFFDFHIQNQNEKDMKKYNISESLVSQSKIIDTFITKFNNVMNTNEK